jgi:hypothetical protein
MVTCYIQILLAYMLCTSLMLSASYLVGNGHRQKPAKVYNASGNEMILPDFIALIRL